MLNAELQKPLSSVFFWDTFARYIITGCICKRTSKSAHYETCTDQVNFNLLLIFFYCNLLAYMILSSKLVKPDKFFIPDIAINDAHICASISLIKFFVLVVVFFNSLGSIVLASTIHTCTSGTNVIC